MTEHEEMRKVLLDYEYEMIFQGEAVEMLDRWLENWLYRKDHCPRCGNVTLEELGERSMLESVK